MASKLFTDEQYARLQSTIKGKIPAILSAKPERAVQIIKGVFSDAGIEVSGRCFKIKDGKITSESLESGLYNNLKRAKAEKDKNKQAKEIEDKKKEEKDADKNEQESSSGISLNITFPKDRMKQLKEDLKNKKTTPSAIRQELRETFTAQAKSQLTPEQMTELHSSISMKNLDGSSTQLNVGAGKNIIDICCDLYMAIICEKDRAQILGESKEQTQQRERMENQDFDLSTISHEMTHAKQEPETRSISSTEMVLTEDERSAFGPSRSVTTSQTIKSDSPGVELEEARVTLETAPENLTDEMISILVNNDNESNNFIEQLYSKGVAPEGTFGPSKSR